MHCVAFIVDASTIAYMGEDLFKKFQDIRQEANDRCKIRLIKSSFIATDH
jgi:hypothetical protein